MQIAAAIVAASAALALAGCGSSAKPPATTKQAVTTPVTTPTVAETTTTATVATLDTRRFSFGTALVTSAGRTLYTFAPDQHRQATCTSSCADTWPPLLLAAGQRPAAGHGVTASRLGSDSYPGGRKIVTYDGWPLYTFTGDSAAGAATGQTLDLNGGKWYAISPSGTPITRK
jgi:predicted lipoprotein with Yx(FWY)xxD motif